MKSLVIGAGEVGKAIYNIIKVHHGAQIRDIKDLKVDGVEVLHICYPDHDGFVNTTLRYVAQYRPKLTIIHSSVKVGTTEKIGGAIVYSPVRGRHPNLENEIKIYEKFVSGLEEKDVELAFQYFRDCGLVVVRDYDPRGMELFKLLSNIHMGLEVAWRQEVERILDRFSVDPDAYESWERTYADGYLKLGQSQLIRSRMRPDPIGGHCIIPCTEILSGQFPSKAFDFILESNRKKKQEKVGLSVI